MKVTLSVKSIMAIDTYIAHYRRYFLELYSDTGLGESEQIIQKNYRAESRERKKEILSLIERRISHDTVLGHTLVNSLLLPWRSKIILLTWEDIGEVRRVTDIEIR